ncbi:MAG TPA: arginine--tRNA ligase, partial [Acidimicrobiales bacterium]|nr:arginine--tRNA ligase [Acidimicrobiales bacterium]
MADVTGLIEARLGVAYDSLEPGSDPVLRPSDHADFQSNGALPLAKRLGRNPREVAEAIVSVVDLDGICSVVEVSGPGFINLTLDSAIVESTLTAMATDPRLSIAEVAVRDRIIVDYSAPNVAKEMHVGHLRTTCIGDALCRILGFLGYEIVRENHIGDWGTPFGMLIEHLIDIGEDRAVEELSVGDLTSFYQDARKSFDGDPTFSDRARARVVALQAGDDETVRLWKVLVEESVAYFNEVYSKLGVLLTDDDIVGESFYNPMLRDVVSDLRSMGLLRENEGAQCVFVDGFLNREGEPLPLIVQKSDGGFGYAATDLAAIRDRVERLGGRRILYVVGVEQSQHLAMCFAAARLAGWLPDGVRAEHVSHGAVLGEDRKRLRTRAGSSVKLVALLDEAVDRAREAIATRAAGYSAEEAEEVAQAVGIGAIKYADLSTDRDRDYVFDFDRMLAFDGDTGPYLQYAHARIRSVLRRAEDDGLVPGPQITLV